MTMPGMSGHETFVRMRAIRRDLPVIVSSGHSETEALRKFMREDIAGFMQKPYTAAKLAAKVQHVLRRGEG